MDTEPLNLINMVIEYLADIWARFFAPVSIDKTVMKNGHKVRIRVEEADE